MLALNLSGQRFGRLIVEKRAVNGPRGNTRWICQCDCGTRRTIDGIALVRGATVSCGCFSRDWSKARFTTHGKWRSPEYRSWDAMIQRCTNENNPRWEYYGGSGIKVCNRWRQSFAAFCQDMGQRPGGTTLDRFPNRDGN